MLPFLAWLVITGGLNLYKPEIERIVYREWLARPSNGPALPVSAIVADVERTTGASVTHSRFRPQGTRAGA